MTAYTNEVQALAEECKEMIGRECDYSNLHFAIDRLAALAQQAGTAPQAQPSAAGAAAVEHRDSVALWWNTVHAEARALAPSRGLGDLLDAVEQYADRRVEEALAQPEAPAVPEPCRPDILERLTYHAFERDDLTLEEVLDVMTSGWKKVRGRTERELLLQLLDLMASQPAHGEQP